MKALKMQFSEALNTPAAPLLFRVAKITWANLTLFLLADLLMSLALLPAIFAWMLQLPLLAPWLAALTFAPAWTTTSALANRLLAGEAVNWRDLAPTCRSHWWGAVKMSALPALVLTLFAGTWEMLAAYPQMNWLYLPLFVDSCAATLVILASLSAFAIAPARSLTGWNIWRVSCAVTLLRLGPTLAVLALFAGLGLLLLVLNAGLLPLLFAPLALSLAALSGQTSEQLRQKRRLNLSAESESGVH